MISTHDLKIDLEHYRAVEARLKPFEFRIMDRDYKVGDRICLRAYDRGLSEYIQGLGIIYGEITYILDLDTVTFAKFPPGFGILGIYYAPLTKPQGGNPISSLITEDPDEFLKKMTGKTLKEFDQGASKQLRSQLLREDINSRIFYSRSEMTSLIANYNIPGNAFFRKAVPFEMVDPRNYTEGEKLMLSKGSKTPVFVNRYKITESWIRGYLLK